MEAPDPGPEPGTVGLDPGWIAAQVTVDGARPIEAEFGGFIGTGQMSRNARFRLDWGDRRGPDTVVVKVPSAEPVTRAISFEHGVYERECTFYRSVSSLVDVAAPTALAVHFDQAAQDFAVVLEDLAGSQAGDQFTEATDDQLILAIEQAAALHGPLWGQTDHPALDPYRRDVDEVVARTDESMPMLLSVVMERLGAGLEPGIAELLERFGAAAGGWIRQSRQATTLVHGDFRPDNFLFGVEAEARPLAIVDWQTLDLGLGVTDIAYLLGAAVVPERRRQIEHDLLDRYRNELAKRGIDYPNEQCLADYAIGSLHGLAIAIRATVVADRTERGDALFTLMLNRHGQHAIDLEAIDRLEATT